MNTGEPSTILDSAYSWGLMRLTALWWWIDRWRKSSAYMDMTLEQQGAYRNLLDEAHLRGGALPTDERILAKACGDALAWRRVRKVVLARFVLVDGCWRNSTLDSVLEESQRRAKKQADYRARQNETGNADGNDIGNEAGNKARPPVPVPVLQDLGASASGKPPGPEGQRRRLMS